MSLAPSSDLTPELLDLTSHLPAEGTVARRLLDAARAAGLFDRVAVLSFDDDTVADDLTEADEVGP